jgi:iron(III) transport system ATP-binding protein
LTISGVTKSFGATPVLCGVDLRVPAGALTAILGPSGCGKTTLLRIIAGFERPDSGAVTLDDGRVMVDERRALPPEQRRIGYVAQEGALFPHLDVAANISFGLPRGFPLRRGGAGQAQARVAELLELVGLDGGHARRYPHELSGGEQQRVALARTLAPRPNLVLLDEPFSSLDAALRDETRRAVARALAAAGATAILVTHDQGEAISLASQLAVMRAGQLVQVGAPAELYQQPVDLGVATFLGEAVLLPGRLHGATARCALGCLPVHGPLPVGADEVVLLLRPEQILVEADAAAGAAGVDARVIEVSFYGPYASVQLLLNDSGARLMARVPGHLTPCVGQQVRVRTQSAARAFPAPPVAIDAAS